MKRYTVLKPFTTQNKDKLVINGDTGYLRIETKTNSCGSRIDTYKLYSTDTRDCLGSIFKTEVEEYLKVEE